MHPANKLDRKWLGNVGYGLEVLCDFFIQSLLMNLTISCVLIVKTEHNFADAMERFAIVYFSLRFLRRRLGKLAFCGAFSTLSRRVLARWEGLSIRRRR